MFGKKKQTTIQPFEVGDLSVRSATINDEKVVRTLVLEAAKSQPSLIGLNYSDLKKETDDYWKDWLHTLTKSSHSTFVLIEHKQEGVIGFLLVEGEPDARFSHTATLTPLYIREEHRNEQVEQEIIVSVLDQMHDAGAVKKIKMCLTPDNAKEFPLYGSAGFVRFGFDEQHLKVGKKFYDCVLLVKSF